MLDPFIHDAIVGMAFLSTYPRLVVSSKIEVQQTMAHGALCGAQASASANKTRRSNSKDLSLVPVLQSDH